MNRLVGEVIHVKRILALTFVLCLLVSSALADTFSLEDNRNLRYDVETFTTDIPSGLREAFAQTPFAADEVICGAVVGYYYHNLSETPTRHGLMAVRHGETRLLLAAEQKKGVWDIWPASETLLRDGEDFAITVTPLYGRYSAGEEIIASALLTVDYGADQFLLSVGDMMSAPSRICELHQYRRLDASGDGLILQQKSAGHLFAQIMENGQKQREEYPEDMPGNYMLRWPEDAAYIDGDTFPTTEEALAAWAAAHPLREDVTYIFGANLRQRATSKSASLGKYHYAPLTILGQEEGTEFPWYHVRIGDTEGYVSGNYVASPDDPIRTNNFVGAQSTPLRVAKAVPGASLYADMSGKVKQALPDGASALILAEADGWYHVALAQEGEWYAADDAVYGYLRARDVQVYESWLQMKYGVISNQ